MKLSTVQMRGHELASLDAIHEELCHSAALRIARQTASRSQVGMVTLRYDLIAKEIRSLRPRPLSKEQKERVERSHRKVKEMENIAERLKSLRRTLIAAWCQLSPGERAVVKDAMWELSARFDGADAVAEEFIVARLASGYRRSTTADALLRRMKKDGGTAALFLRLERAIRRYLFARENDEPRLISPLFHPLALEWLRDEKALWKFLSVCLDLWHDLAINPRSRLRRKIVIHQIAERTGHDSFAIQAHLQAIDALPRVSEGNADNSQRKLINKHVSLDVSKARANRREFRVP